MVCHFNHQYQSPVSKYKIYMYQHANSVLIDQRADLLRVHNESTSKHRHNARLHIKVLRKLGNRNLNTIVLN